MRKEKRKKERERDALVRRNNAIDIVLFCIVIIFHTRNPKISDTR
jgi:hypothetical protein